MRTDLGFALALMNNTWPDLELLPEEKDRPIHRHEVVYSSRTPTPHESGIGAWSLTVPTPSSTDQQ